MVLLELMRSGIYKIRNIKNNKIYIGSALHFRKRKWEHDSMLFRGKHHSRHLQASYNKHGEDCFVFEIVEYVDDKTKLIEREQYYIDILKPEYNGSMVAGSVLGVKQSKETIKKRIATRRANGQPWISEKQRLGLKETSKGNQNHKGHKHTEEMKSKASELAKERCSTEEFREFMRKVNLGNQNKKGKACSEATKKILREKNLGKVESELTRQRKSLAVKEIWRKRKELKGLV